MRRSELAQLLLLASGSAIRLYEWQRRFLDDESRFRVLVKSRGVGGSFLIALESFLDCAMNHNYLVLLMSYSMKQCLELFRRVKELVGSFQGVSIRFCGEAYRFSAVVSETRTRVEFPNGSRIISLPNNPDGVRGYRADHIYIDEAAMFRDDFQLKTAAAFTTTAQRGRITLVSTPKGKRGWFHEAYQAGKRKKGWSLHSAHYSECKHISEEEIRELRTILTHTEFRQEMELEFLDERGALIPYDAILACVSDYTPEPERVENPVFMGIDFGRYRDSTVITGVELLPDNSLRVVYLRELRGADFGQQLRVIEEAATRLRPVCIAVDKTGMGLPLYERLASRLPQTEGITITSSIKEALATTLCNLIQNRRLTIPADATELINQLSMFQRKLGKSGTRYEAPEGAHDDYVISLALAVYSAIREPRRGVAVERFWSW